MTIHLPEPLENSIREAVHRGQFASIDAAMAEAARLLLHTLTQRQAAPATPPVGQEPPAEGPKPIWELFQEISADVPAEEWDKLPADLAEQHDHYIYGTPKRPVA
jgi:Arc/MetJ-type ribon-helix-helix transcriptional regulator